MEIPLGTPVNKVTDEDCMFLHSYAFFVDGNNDQSHDVAISISSQTTIPLGSLNIAGGRNKK